MITNNLQNNTKEDKTMTKKRKYKKKTISLGGDRMLIYAIKKAGMNTFNPRGKWNGWGYEQLPMVVEINSLGDMRKYNKIKKECDERRSSGQVRILTGEQKKEAWARRLSRLTDIDFDEATEIADEKLEAKQERIDDLERRQDERGYSVRRERLINKLCRENPLRYIKDENHAYSILEAHNRHTKTPYDTYLSLIHDMEEDELLERGYAKDLARLLISGRITLNDVEEYSSCPDVLINECNDYLG